jgi:hypothetical protein
MKSVELPIAFHTDNTRLLDQLDIGYNIEDSDIRQMQFYNVSAIAPYYENRKQFTKVYCAGDVFICVLTYNETANLLSKF